jgi:septum site-determining protein MinD
MKAEANINNDRFYNLIMRLSDLFDYVLIDCPAGIDSGFHRAVSIAREAIIVTTPHISAIRDADKVISILSTYNMIDISLIINRVRGDLIMRGEMMSAGDISRLLGLKISGIIPEDDSLTIHNRLDNPNIIGSSQEAYNIFAENIINNTNDVYDCTHKYRGIGGKIKLALRKDL